ncbi:MAG: arylsulfotransferase family protein [Bdellovibrionota bacterium]
MKTPKRLVSEVLLLLICTLVIGVLYFKSQNQSYNFKPEAKLSKPALKVVAPKALSRDTKAQAFAGLTLYPEAGTGKVHLISMQGQSIHQWKVDAMRARLLKNCNLLVIHGTKWGMDREPWRSLRKKVREYDWSGNVVWEYEAPEAAHHDIHRLDNGNTLFLYKTLIPEAQRLTLKDPIWRQSNVRSDAILEVSPAGEVAWQWFAHDYLDPNKCGERGCPELKKAKLNEKEVDWTHLNTASPLPENKHYDAGDQRFKPGNILILPRNWWMTLLIDKQSGKVVWDYSGDYKGGLSGGHEAQMIAKDLPGEGNILIFDNGRSSKQSYALEINPITKEVVWVYDAGQDFFSEAAGSLQRLPNGNTLLSEDTKGRVLEVSPEGEIVWQYQGEFRSARAQRYAYDYCPKLQEYREK